MDGRRARIVLGVGNDAGPAEIRRAFRARALVTHPDHGGSRAAFAELLEAFESLGTASTRSAPQPEPTLHASDRRPAAARAGPARPPPFDAYDSPPAPPAAPSSPTYCALPPSASADSPERLGPSAPRIAGLSAPFVRHVATARRRDCNVQPRLGEQPLGPARQVTGSAE